MLTIFVLLFVLSLAAAALLHAGPAAWHDIFWVFGGFAALNLLYVIFWVFVDATVDDTKPLEEKPRAIYTSAAGTSPSGSASGPGSVCA